MVALTWENADFAWDNDLELTWSDETFEPIVIGAVYPDPSQVALGVQYGPNGDDYIGTLSPGSGGPTGPGGIPVIIPVSLNNQPVDGVAVWITTDPEGTNQIAGILYTNTFGNTKPAFTLEPGIFYVWVQKAGINFTNPHALQVLENGTYQWYTG